MMTTQPINPLAYHAADALEAGIGNGESGSSGFDEDRGAGPHLVVLMKGKESVKFEFANERDIKQAFIPTST
jgi:hypothetical protein